MEKERLISLFESLAACSQGGNKTSGYRDSVAYMNGFDYWTLLELKREIETENGITFFSLDGYINYLWENYFTIMEPVFKEMDKPEKRPKLTSITGR